MDFFKSKQPIALPPDSEDEKLMMKGNKSLDPELGANPPQQECERRCCFKKGSRGRKVVRRIGHFIIISTFLYWFCRPSVKFHHGGHQLPAIQIPDFADFDEIPSVIPEDFVWVRTSLHYSKRERLTSIAGCF